MAAGKGTREGEFDAETRRRGDRRGENMRGQGHFGFGGSSWRRIRGGALGAEKQEGAEMGAGSHRCTGRAAMVDCLPVNCIDLLQGTLDLMILQTLRWGPQHGHGIGQAIRAS